MKQSIGLFTLLACLTLAACNEEKLPLYNAGNYIQFSAAYTDSTMFSFSFHPGEETYQLSIPVEITAGGLTENTPYTVEVDTKASTAVSGTHYDFATQQSFRTQRFVDSCQITLHRTADMNTKTYRIVLRLRSNDRFKLGQSENTLAIINVNDMISMPSWWTRNPIEFYYLGKYSDKKYKLFIEHTGISDMTGMSASQMRYYSLVFKRWLKSQSDAGTPIREDNETQSLMEVAVVGE